jgi:hypothetical protein
LCQPAGSAFPQGGIEKNLEHAMICTSVLAAFTAPVKAAFQSFCITKPTKGEIMGTVLKDVGVGTTRKIPTGTASRKLPTGHVLSIDKALQARYDSLGGLKVGFGPLVKKEGAFWYYQNGCLCYKNGRVFELHGDIYKKWVKLGGKNFGRPDTDESPCTDGQGRYSHFENGSKTIFWHPSTGANAVWGDIKLRWAALGWERSYLGYPTSDEVNFPDGGRVNAFQRGGIYWWPDTGAIDMNDVVVHYTGLMCFKESVEDQSSDSDEPYVVIGTVTPFGSGAFRSKTYSGVDTNESYPDLMEIYRGKPNGFALTLRLMEHDHGDRNKITQDIAKGMTEVHKIGTKALEFIPVVGSGIAAVAGPLIQQFIPGIAGSVNRIFGFDDDEIGRQTIVLTGKDMILAARRSNATRRGIGFKFASNHLRGGGSNYQVYFGLVPI